MWCCPPEKLVADQYYAEPDRVEQDTVDEDGCMNDHQSMPVDSNPGDQQAAWQRVPEPMIQSLTPDIRQRGTEDFNRPDNASMATIAGTIQGIQSTMERILVNTEQRTEEKGETVHSLLQADTGRINEQRTNTPGHQFKHQEKKDQ